jgi:hypothetical protein
MVSVMYTFVTWIRSLYAGILYLQHEIAATLADNYCPELHYMRGPGPKWCEKHAVVPKATSSRR